MDWLDLPAVQGTLKSLLQHHSSKASILLCSTFFIVQLSHPYVTTGKTIALTRWTFVGKLMSLLQNMLSRLVITFLPRSKHPLISWLQSPSAVILTPPPNPPKLAIISVQLHLASNSPFTQFHWIHSQRSLELNYGYSLMKVTNYFPNVWGSIKFQKYLALSNFICF